MGGRWEGRRRGGIGNFLCLQYHVIKNYNKKVLISVVWFKSVTFLKLSIEEYFLYDECTGICITAIGLISSMNNETT